MNGLAYIWKRILNYFYSIIGTENMGTTATTVKGAIAEHENDIATLNDYVYGTITGTYIENAIAYEKIGRICIVRISVLKNLPNGETTIGTMPSGLRPKNYNAEFIAFNPTTSGTNRAIRITIKQDGTINAYNYGDAVTGLINTRARTVYLV